MARQAIDTFILRNDFFPQIRMLTREQRGDLLTAVFAHATGEQLPEMDQVTELCFGFIRASMDANTERYRQRCQTNRENGSRGGRPVRNANAAEENRSVCARTERIAEKPAKAGGFSREPDDEDGIPAEPDDEDGIPAEPDDEDGIPRKPSDGNEIPQEPDDADRIVGKPSNGGGISREPSDGDRLAAKPDDASGIPQEPDDAGRFAGKPGKADGVSGKPGKADEVSGKPGKADEVSGKPGKADGFAGKPQGKGENPIDSYLYSYPYSDSDLISFSAEEREHSLKILLFDKRILDPLAELDRFCTHYAKSGWVDANGNPIRNRLAALKAWNPAKEAERCSARVAAIWREVYETATAADPQTDYTPMLYLFRGVFSEGAAIHVTVCDKRLVELMERPACLEVVRPIIDRHFGAGKQLHYRVPKPAPLPPPNPRP